MKRLLLTNLDPLPEHGEVEHLAPWSLSEAEHRDAPWEAFGFAPPFPRGRIGEVARATEALSEYLLRGLAEDLNRRHGESRSPAYWRLLLMGWLITLVHVSFERYLRVREKARKGTPFEVLLAPAGGEARIENSRHFMALLLDAPLNRLILCRVVEHLRPGGWALAEGPALELEPPLDADVARTWKLGLLHWYSVLASALGGVQFYNVHGVSPVEVLRLGLHVLGRRLRGRRPGLERRRALPEAPSREKAAEGIEGAGGLEAGEGEGFIRLVEKLAAELMPRSFTDAYRRNARAARLKALFTAPWVDTLVCGPVLGKDEAAKFHIARLMESRDLRLLIHQHGSCYGMIETFSYTNQVEYAACDAFLSWGWRRHSNYLVRGLPVPSPALSRRKADRSQVQETLIFVGELPILYPLRIESDLYTYPEDIESYRKQKIAFIGALGPSPRAALRYRPYMYKFGFLYDEPYMRDRVPGLEVVRGSRRQFMKLLESCRLAVMDYPGTALMENIASGIPTVFYLNEEVWIMQEPAREALRRLREAGVYHASPGSAAAHVNAVWGDVDGWWEAPATRAALEHFSWNFCRTSENWFSEWADLFPLREAAPASGDGKLPLGGRLHS